MKTLIRITIGLFILFGLAQAVSLGITVYAMIAAFNEMGGGNVNPEVLSATIGMGLWAQVIAFSLIVPAVISAIITGIVALFQRKPEVQK